MNPALDELCRSAAADLSALGALAPPLLRVLDLVGWAAGGRGPGVLADPAFAVELLEAARAGGDPVPASAVGRVLDHLRGRAGVLGVQARGLTVAEAARDWEAEGFALNTPRTRDLYKTWVRRLVLAHGEAEVAGITAADLAGLVAAHTRGPAAGRLRHGRSAEEASVSAFRHFWAYLVEEGRAPRNVALALRRPLRPEPFRRPVRPDEAALFRHLAAMGADPVLDGAVLCLVERLGVRPLEVRRLRLCDIDLHAREAVVTGKGHRPRRLPLPPGLCGVLARYAEDRRPPGVAPEAWAAAPEPFARRRPTEARPLGEPVGHRWIERLFPRVLAGAPQLPGRDGLSLYAYRHAIATWVDARYGRAVTRRILGHSSRVTATDAYVHVDEGTVREAVVAYEEHLLMV